MRWATVVLCWFATIGFSGHVTAADHEFRYRAPEANSVALMAEFNGWKPVPMTRNDEGVWTTTVPLSTGMHAYKFLVNGSDWMFDPDNPNRTKVDGIENSAVEISAETSRAVATSVATRAAPAAPQPSLTIPATPTSAASQVDSSSKELLPAPGEIFTLEVPLSEKRRAEAAKDGNPKLAHARIAIVVPQGFQGQKSWPILVVANTEAYSNIDSLRQFKQAATDEGWVILAADGVELDSGKEGSVRWPCIAAAFDHLSASWPTIKDWPVACGGMSGGAKNSAFLAADLAREHHRVIGMLMMGCNQDMASVAYRKSAPPNFLSASVFLSSGKSDAIATPASHEAVKTSLQATGFRKVRLESFDGAHDIYQPHIGEALRWFLAQVGQSSGSSPSARSSDFDKFFKKKP